MSDSWYYLRDRHRFGPVSLEQIRRAMAGGDLPARTLVWRRGMPEWTLAGETEELGEFVSSLPPQPQPESEPSPAETGRRDAGGSDVGGEEEGSPTTPVPAEPTLVTEIEGVPQVRPWVRYWARQIDLSLALVAYVLVVPRIAPALADPNSMLFLVVPVGLWVGVEALLISSTGFTPGKWLLCTQVRAADESLPSFAQSLQRALWVWLRGLGLGLPVLSLVAPVLSYRDLVVLRQTFWDRQTGLVVRHAAIGPQRAILAAVVLLALAAAFVTAVTPLLPEERLKDSDAPADRVETVLADPGDDAVDPDSIAHAADVIADALHVKAEDQTLERATVTLARAIEAEERMAAELLALMGVGQNLNVKV